MNGGLAPFVPYEKNLFFYLIYISYTTPYAPSMMISAPVV